MSHIQSVLLDFTEVTTGLVEGSNKAPKCRAYYHLISASYISQPHFLSLVKGHPLKASQASNEIKEFISLGKRNWFNFKSMNSRLLITNVLSLSIRVRNLVHLTILCRMHLWSFP